MGITTGGGGDNDWRGWGDGGQNGEGFLTCHPVLPGGKLVLYITLFAGLIF